MSSLSEHERVGLEDVFLSLGKKPNVSDRLKEQAKRSIIGLVQVIKKFLPLSVSYITLKINSIKQLQNGSYFNIFTHIFPKNRGSK